MKIVYIVIIVIIVIITGGAAFFGGMQYQKSTLSTEGANNNMGPENRQMMDNGDNENRNNRERMGMQPVTGEVTSQDDESITVQLSDGSTKIVYINDDTTISNTEEAALSDISQGKTVMVIGESNDDGSIDANMIQMGKTGFNRMQEPPTQE